MDFFSKLKEIPQGLFYLFQKFRELLKAITNPESLNILAGRLDGWLYVLLFAIIFCETGLVIIPFLPGDSLLFAIGALGAIPGSPINLWLMGALLIIAAVAGDAVNYAIGLRLGVKLSGGPDSVLSPPDPHARSGKALDSLPLSGGPDSVLSPPDPHARSGKALDSLPLSGEPDSVLSPMLDSPGAEGSKEALSASGPGSGSASSESGGMGGLRADEVERFPQPASGQVIGEKFQGHRWINPRHIQATHDFYEKYGGKTIVLARFVPIVRTFAPFVAGIAKMSYRHFALYNVTGGILWVSLLMGAGRVFGGLPWVKKHFEAVIYAIIFISILPAAIEFLKAHLKDRKTSKR